MRQMRKSNSKYSTNSYEKPKTAVCKFYVTGNCTFGDRCRYYHPYP